jgi:hypothetical protein
VQSVVWYFIELYVDTVQGSWCGYLEVRHGGRCARYVHLCVGKGGPLFRGIALVDMVEPTKLQSKIYLRTMVCNFR